MNKTIPKRSEVAVNDTWDLEKIYPSKIEVEREIKL